MGESYHFTPINSSVYIERFMSLTYEVQIAFSTFIKTTKPKTYFTGQFEDISRDSKSYQFIDLRLACLSFLTTL